MADFSAWLEKNKGLWTRVYDEVIAPDFEQEWKRRVEDHEKELKTKDDNRQIVLAHVNDEIIKNARLQEENARLKKLLQRHDAQTSVHTTELQASTEEATVTVDEYRHLTDQYSDLNQRYREAGQRIKYLERKNVVVMQKNKEMKESVRAWKEYCDRHVGKQKAKSETKPALDMPKPLSVLQAPDARPVLPSSPRTPQSLVGQIRSSPAPIAPLAQVTFPPPSPDHSAIQGDISPRKQFDTETTHERVEEELPAWNYKLEETGPAHASVAFLGRPDADKLGSSQTTVDEVAEQNLASTKTGSAAECDDAPQIVSERSLRRKRKRSTGHDAHRLSDGTSTKPIRVKEEIMSSPPLPDEAVQLFRKETMDLDELGPNAILSPRRRRLRRTFSIHSTQTGVLRNQRSTSVPLSGPLTKIEQNAEDSLIFGVDEMEPEGLEAADSRAISEPRDQVRIGRDILKPLDPNGPHPANAGTPNKRIKRKEVRQQEAYNVLAESDDTPPPFDDKDRRRPPKLALEHYNQRVRANKNGNTPEKSSHSTPRTAPARVPITQQAPPQPIEDRSAYTPSARPGQRKLPASEPRTEPQSRTRVDCHPVAPIWSMAPPSETARKAPPAPSSEQVPLRERDYSNLTIYDFKPNPRYNQGHTYAFRETVRKRSDRLCLPGCTNATCCGSTFRALASAAQPLTSSQEEELLQEHLGDAYDSFGLTQMNQEERDEVVLQARTRQMANEFGKHKQIGEGRKTPPGFWDMGFPSTQTQEENRRNAAQMQQDVVKERWHEAMRNGKWIFKDE